VGDYSTIIFEVGDDHVATLTLNRPETLNSFNETMAAEVVDVWRTVRDTDDIHCRAAPRATAPSAPAST
jgi:enoyl-CoA hydratase/carnithine racemase